MSDKKKNTDSTDEEDSIDPGTIMPGPQPDEMDSRDGAAGDGADDGAGARGRTTSATPLRKR